MFACRVVGVGQSRESDVDRPVGTGEDGVDDCVDVVAGKAQVAGEEVPGAGREDRDGDPGAAEFLGGDPQCPVAADNEDDVGGAVGGCSCGGAAAVVSRCRVPAGRCPPVPDGSRVEYSLELVLVGLGRVEDDRGSASGCV